MKRRITVRWRPTADAWLTLAAFGVSLAVYLPTLSPTVVLDDGGELQMLATTLGVPHPTGYPLFTVLGWLFTRLPLGGDAAFRVTLFCALTAAISVALIYLVARELQVGRAAALSAALLAAAAPRVWMHASAAEVYSLANLFILLGIWLLLRWGAGKTSLWVVTLALGFGLTHHISLRLFGPAMLVYILWIDPRLPLKPRRWLPALACLVLPLALYAYLPLRAAHFMGLPQWTGDILGIPKAVASGLVSPHYAAGFWNLVLALDYSQQFLAGQSGEFGQVVVQFLNMSREQFPLLAFPFMLLGIVHLFRRKPRANWLLMLSAVTVLALGLRFLALVGEDGDSFIPVYLLLALWFAAGADAVLAWLGPRLARLRWARTLLLAGLCAIPLSSVVGTLPQMVDMRQTDWSQAFLAQPLRQGAVLVGDWNIVTPLRYRQRVDSLRPDLWILHADANGARLLMARAFAEGRPFYAVRRTVAGPRLLPLPAPRDAEIMHPANLVLGSVVRWRGHDLEPAQPRAGEVLELGLYWQPVERIDRDWTTFVHLLDEQGNRLAQIDRVPGNEIYPPTLWEPGQLIVDQYELSLPDDLPAGRYRIEFGWYGPEGRLEWADGANVRTLTELNIAHERRP